MKKTLHAWFDALTGDTARSWPPVREYVKKWCIASLLLLMALLVTEVCYANAACSLLRANVAGDPTLTENQLFVLSAMLHYPVFMLRALETGTMTVLVTATVSLCCFDWLLSRFVKRTQCRTPDETSAEVARD